MFWWKIFYLYSLPTDVIEDANRQRIIKHLLLKVLEKEEIGIPVSTELLDELDTPIVDEKDIPSMFIPKPFPIVECYNYPDSDKMLDFDANQNIMDPNMVEFYSQGELLTQPEDD